MGTYRYKVSYSLDAARREEPGLTLEELEQQNRIGCDAVLLVSILFPPGEVPDADFSSLDGRTGTQLSIADLFSAWLAWAKKLSQDPRLDAEQRYFVQMVYLSARERDTEALPGGSHGVSEA